MSASIEPSEMKQRRLGWMIALLMLALAMASQWLATNPALGLMLLR
ncbi:MULTISPECIES: hypothetical protein [Shewanella]|uniref:Uncharacterized protein n=1 Tax=Shewanella litorisediminis TaxID=1173586 RepID=A0ABX7G1F7_9GAMM|nr:MULTISPECIES: hypothetical protein [Shewanella]MCL2919050.1 hypothetical protein [Shewanella litorisediminis]QRH01113.1 hypothetical protein JQC75_14780 [Shewanella litorisediminis]QYJ74627.1 hypothetical protein K0H79_14900 [Shewanella sp. FJAT-52076]QYK04499.1 hypothetical protein K0H63_15750 [Shewanella zhangzhouensis]